MKTYWTYRRFFDVLASTLFATFSILAGRAGYSMFTVDVPSVSANVLGAAVSLFGLIAATVAFMFNVIESDDFTVLRKSKSQRQLWEIFSDNLQWLFCGSVWCFVCALLRTTLSSTVVVLWLASFLAAGVIANLAKFSWLMGQILSVRIARSVEH